ncbi:hypothetical protein [Amycolatopsis magusensis]|uniref:hypothetical protein n=1 Tax=Amycolatopsis magusensis TaxID=882444 RepID=UPI00379D5E3A
MAQRLRARLRAGGSMVLGSPIPLVRNVRTPNVAFACGTTRAPPAGRSTSARPTGSPSPEPEGAATLDKVAVLIDDLPYGNTAEHLRDAMPPSPVLAAHLRRSMTWNHSNFIGT